MKFPATIRCTECPLSRLGVLFSFTKEIGDAQRWVPKPERLWGPQIKQGVLVQFPWGLWGPASPLVLPTPPLPWPFPLSPPLLQPARLSPLSSFTQRAAHREFSSLSPNIKALNFTGPKNLQESVKVPPSEVCNEAQESAFLTSIPSGPDTLD